MGMDPLRERDPERLMAAQVLSHHPTEGALVG
jgi:hypothetical protein